MAKGIASVKGNALPKIGTENFYEVESFYPGTIIPKNEAEIKWKLFAQESTGIWRELRGTQKNGRRVPFNFPQKWYGKKILIEAYLNSPEMKSPPGIIVMPVGGDRKIESIGFFDSNWKPLTKTPKYGHILNIRINTINMLGETLQVSLWERDTYKDTGHDPNENTNIWGSERPYKVKNTNGRVEFSLLMDPSWAILADKGVWDIEGSEHEYYLLVKGAGAKTKYSVQRSVKDEVAQPQNTKDTSNSSPTPINAEYQEPIKVGGLGVNPAPPNDVISPAIIKEVDIEKVEGLIDAYFAKKEFTKETGEQDGTAEYIFGGKKVKNKTSTLTQKESIATIILRKVTEKLKPEKKYTTKDVIVKALTANEYGSDSTNKKVEFQTFKLGPDFKKISSASLEEKVYLVAKTYLLDSKKATIIVKEKDGIIKGAADATLPILEITEEQMASTVNSEEVQGTEKTEFTGTVKDNMIIIPVHLRPKLNDELKKWKETLAKGKEDGEYTYTFGGPANIKHDSEKKQIAESILNNAKKGLRGNPKIEEGKIAYTEDIVNILTSNSYAQGNTVKFKLYKKLQELLYLQVKAQGEKQHDKEFLKSEEAYFVIGRTKEITFPLLVKPENDKNNKWGKDYYWAAKQGNNMATFNTGRAGNRCGTWKRMHAARDLYTNPETEVVAICKGVVLEVKAFYSQTDQVTVLHETNDGRKFIVRYGELAPDSILVKKDDKIEQKQKLGVTGKLLKGDGKALLVRNNQVVFMLHFEIYSGKAGYDINIPLSNCEPPFARRNDLIEPIEILEEGYRNTFEGGSKPGNNPGNRVAVETLKFSQNGLNFLKGYETEIKKEGKHVYFNDGYGFCTIGYGHLIAGKHSCETITIPENFKNGLDDDQANALLFEDIQRISNLVKSKVTVNLLQNEFDAVVSLAFNVEASVGDDSTLLRKLNGEDYEGAADEFKNWRKAGGVVAPGLVKRRAQETEIFKNNLYDSTH